MRSSHPCLRIFYPVRQITAAVAALILGTAACATQTPDIKPAFIDSVDCAGIDRRPLPTEGVDLRWGDRSITLDVEVAVEDQERQQGLMCRSHVPDGTGMLFERPSISTHGFWMFNTYTSLDLLYFDRGGATVATARLGPCPRADGEGDDAWRSRCAAEAAPHAPGKPYLFVLELPAGWLESQGVSLDQAVDSVTLARK